MAVKLRLKRMGRKKEPVYRLVVAASQTARNGSSIEEIGLYNPLIKPLLFEFDEERVKYWLGQGAQPTATVKRLLSKKGVLKPEKVTSNNQKVSKKLLKKEDTE